MKKRICLIIVLLLISGAAVCGVYLNTAYNDAVALIQSGSYEQALNKFEKTTRDKIDRDNFLWNASREKIKAPYKNTPYLYAYALAQLEYNDEYGNMSTVNNLLELIPVDYSGELCSEIKTFKKNFKPQYDEYLAEQERKAEEKRLEEIKREEERLRNSIPYVGMSESNIANTSLGSPSPTVRHNSQVIGGNVYKANIYDFKSGSRTIFTARCVQGKVTEVLDKRDAPKSTYTPSTPNKKSSTEKSDPYNVYEYYDAEDFYEDNYDDFFEYEEAEDYYNDAWD